MEINEEALKILTEGFADVKKQHSEIKEDIHFISQRLFGDPNKKVDSLIQEVEDNKDRSKNNERSFNQIKPQHEEMFSFYTKMKGVILGYTLVSVAVGAIIWKGLGFIISKF
jgi:hypothetical protein